MVNVEDAITDSHLDSVRALMRAFIDWHRVRHVEHLDLIYSYFDANAYEEELRTLPGVYSPPKGRLLLVTVDGKPAGCVAMRPTSDDCCEMKRMFVYSEFQGRGVGRALAVTIVQAGRLAGYKAMRLDTGILQAEAIGLYESIGFQKVAPYYELPQEMSRLMLFMELRYGAT